MAVCHRLLRVNFDPLIVRLLREVKYLLLLGLRVPESALEIYERGEVGMLLLPFTAVSFANVEKP